MKTYKRVGELAKTTGVSESTLWRWVQRGILPKPLKVTNRTTLWDVEAVDAAIVKMAEAQNG